MSGESGENTPTLSPATFGNRGNGGTSGGVTDGVQSGSEK